MSKWKVQVLKDSGWQDLNPEMFTFSSAETAGEVAQRYNENPNEYVYRAVETV